MTREIASETSIIVRNTLAQVRPLEILSPSREGRGLAGPVRGREGMRYCIMSANN